MDHELDKTEQLLRDQRPDIDDARLERVRGGLVGRRRPARRTFPKLATALLGTGLVLSFGGSGLAVSGLAADSTAVQAQYPTTPTTSTTGESATQPSIESLTTPTQQAAPTGSDDEGGSGSGPGAGSGPGSGGDDEEVLGDTARSPDEASVDNTPRELAAVSEGEELPFTGLAALPIILLGLASLGIGLVLRRRTEGPAPV